MKKNTGLLFALTFSVVACNNEGKDSVEKADSVNEAKLDSPAARPSIVTDEESTSFLVNGANAGMAEVQLGELAQRKAMNQQVKDFGSMIEHNHNVANDQVRALAVQRNVTLPATVGDEKRNEIDDLSRKSGADFDKAFLRAIVKGHNQAIDLFGKASDKVKDTEVKTFVDNTLPKLRNYLDSAKAIQKALR